MAEIVLSLTRDHLLPIFKEVTDMIRGIPIDEVSDMKHKLESIQAFIQDADRMFEDEEDNSRAEMVRGGIEKLREAAFLLEDVIDEYIMVEEQQSRNFGCAALACEPINFIKTMTLRHQISRKFRLIKSDVPFINKSILKDQIESFQIQAFLSRGPSGSEESQSIQWRRRQMAPALMDEDDIIGFEAPKNNLIDWLVNERAERTVICVVGMGGLGKTTLARSVFNNNVVLQYFHCHIWIKVSQSYTVEGLLRSMLRFCMGGEISCNISEMDRWSLIDEVRKYLHEKRYVIFFDDVWDTHFWEEIEFVAIDNKIGSRIFITTRNRNVALSFKKSSFVYIHQLQPLPSKKSWELFCKKAFRFDFGGQCPEQLLDISQQIVKKCEGNPLVIVAVAGLISIKEKSEPHLKQFLESLNSKFESNSFLRDITKIISLGYDDLPSYLKSCFLYFGMYPDDYEVDTKRLIWQWIAEGFIKPERGIPNLEEVAEEYLIELINRSLVHVSSFTTDGKAKTCRVHNLLRHKILKKCKDSRFCLYISEDNDPSVLGGIVRRLSIATSSHDPVGSIDSSHVRSLLFFINKESSYVSKIPAITLLKVLDFENAQLSSVPKNLENLFHLRYLSFRNTQIKSLPESIGMLQNLETLDVRQTHVPEMPKEISKLRWLRHLLASGVSLILLKDCIGDMKLLQTLSKVRVDDGGEELIRELGRLSQLRKLGLTNIAGQEHGRAICSLIFRILHLEKLNISTKDDNVVIDLDFMIPSYRGLQKLRIHGKLNKLPRWISEMKNLVHLVLSSSKLTEDPLMLLDDLPILLKLSVINGGYEGETLLFRAGRFTRLRELELGSLSKLSSIVIGEGALRSLEKLKLKDIPQLETVPSDFFHLPRELVLYIQNMPTKFEEDIIAAAVPLSVRIIDMN